MKARKVLILAFVPVLIVAGTDIALAFGLGNVDGVWGAIDSDGATCDRWTTGPGDNPTAVHSYLWSQTPPNADENQVWYGGGPTELSGLFQPTPSP